VHKLIETISERRSRLSASAPFRLGTARHQHHQYEDRENNLDQSKPRKRSTA
jgi:hypothetical protein